MPQHYYWVGQHWFLSRLSRTIRDISIKYVSCLRRGRKLGRRQSQNSQFQYPMIKFASWPASTRYISPCCVEETGMRVRLALPVWSGGTYLSLSLGGGDCWYWRWVCRYSIYASRRRRYASLDAAEGWPWRWLLATSFQLPHPRNQSGSFLCSFGGDVHERCMRRAEDAITKVASLLIMLKSLHRTTEDFEDSCFLIIP